MASYIVRLRRLMDRGSSIFNAQDFLVLWLRCWLANIFYASGRTKVSGGFLEPSEITVALFEDEYALPFIDPELAAQLAVYGETFLPIFLIVGLASRLSVLGLVGMTLVIQIFVYPALFAEHISWLAAGLAVFVLGPGRLSLDHILFRNVGKSGIT